MAITIEPWNPITSETTQTESLTELPFGLLESKHPEYDADYWALCRALYEGGKKLLGDDAIMAQCFPQHMQEAPAIYAERKRRAYYIAYPALIIDHMMAGLMTCPIECTSENHAEENDRYWKELLRDISPHGGRRQSLQKLLREQMHTALLCKRAWTQVDFPIVDASGLTSVAQQEEIGALNAYAIQIDPSSVYDWEEDDSGELIWCLVCKDSARRSSLLDSRDLITRTYTHYTRTTWSRYEITFDRRKPPTPKTMVALAQEGQHSFGRVPFLRLDLPEGLWAMNKLESLAREHFNKRCALSWAEYKTLFQQLYEFEAPPDPLSMGPAIVHDEQRAVNQVRGIGYVQMRYANDRAEYIGPDSTPFKIALESIKDLRDEMHRVTHQMALTFDNSASALRRSGDSKSQDKAAHGVVLRGLGEILKEYAFDILQTIVTGRGDDIVWQCAGLDKFDDASLQDVLTDAETLENIEIPSPTFQRRHKYMVAKMKLGDEASEEDLKKIDEELETAFATDLRMPGEPRPPIEEMESGEATEERAERREDTRPYSFSSNPSVTIR